MFQFRDKVLVKTEQGVIEGYVYFVPQGAKEVYVILAGQNNKPLLIETKYCEKILEPGQIKRKRGRPRKDKK